MDNLFYSTNSQTFFTDNHFRCDQNLSPITQPPSESNFSLMIHRYSINPPKFQFVAKEKIFRPDDVFTVLEYI